MKEKTRMLRLLIEDVTLTKGDTVHMDIRFVGGATRSLDLPLPKSCVVLRTTDTAAVDEIDGLIDTYTDKEIADLLNERGVRVGAACCAHIRSTTAVTSYTKYRRRTCRQSSPTSENISSIPQLHHHIT